MKQSAVISKSGQGGSKVMEGVKSFLSKFMIKSFKLNSQTIIKKFVVPIGSILLFIGMWYLGAEALRQREIDFKVEKAVESQGLEAGDALKACFASGDPSCQTNTLPSPGQVWASFQSLINDHYLIKADKKAFAEKVAPINEKSEEFNSINADKIAAGEVAKKEPLVYTGRPSFVDQIFRSLKTVFAGFFLSFLIAVPLGIFIGLSPMLKSAFNWFIQIFKPVSPVVWLSLIHI